MAGSYHKNLVLAFSFWLLPLSAWAADRSNLSHSGITGTQAVLWVAHDAGFLKELEDSGFVAKLRGK
jgi:hypothetical protein